MSQAYTKNVWTQGALPAVDAPVLNGWETGIYLASAPLVTSLPASPVDGQECNYIADATNGVVWHFVYRSALGKWVFTGGAPLVATSPDEGISVAASTWSALVTPMQVVAPLAGDYMVKVSAGGYFSNMSNANPYLTTGLSIGGAAPTINWQSGPGFTVPAGQQTFPGRDYERKYTGIAAAAVLQVQHQWVNQAPPIIQTRYMTVSPVKVG